jgi:hypothetical protein
LTFKPKINETKKYQHQSKPAEPCAQHGRFNSVDKLSKFRQKPLQQVEPVNNKDKWKAAVIRLYEYKEKTDVRRSIQDKKLYQNNTFMPTIYVSNPKLQKKQEKED